MAVKFGGAFHYTSITAGNRKQSEKQAAKIIPKSEIGSTQKTVLQGRLQSRSLRGRGAGKVLNTYQASRTLGRSVDTPSTDPRKYRILGKVGIGKRKPAVDRYGFNTPELNPTTRQSGRVLQGIGAYGANVKSQTPTPESKPIRKYPRDWHGENMH